MRCACASNRLFKIPRRVVGTSKPPNSSSERIWTGCCWLSFWLSGGWVIWPLPASITDSVTALIAMIDGTKASFVSGGSGSGIFCDAPLILLPSRVVYPSRNRRMDGASRYDSKYTFRSQKKCRGERGGISRLLAAFQHNPEHWYQRGIKLAAGTPLEFVQRVGG